MKKSVYSLFICLVVMGCKAQEIIKYKNLKYDSFSYHGTLNTSFINKRIVFLDGTDSVFFNVKVPFEIETKKIYDPGIFYNCTLKKDTIYSFELKKANPSLIPKDQNSYYLTNGIFAAANKSKFSEVKKDTKYKYELNGMFIDINHELYLIQKMTPAGDCVFQH